MPVTAIILLAGILWILVNAADLKSRQFRIGSWQIADLRVREMPIVTVATAFAEPPSDLGKAAFRTLQIGPVFLAGERSIGGGPVFSNSGFGADWRTNSSGFQAAIGYHGGEWTASVGIDWK